MINQLKDLKDTFESIRTQIDRGKEPLEDLIKMKNFLNALVEDPKLLHEAVDKDFRKFFYEDLTSGLFKRFTRERSRDEKVSIKTSFSQLFIFLLRKMELIFYILLVFGCTSRNFRGYHARFS
jgi:hypothetical protein